MIFATARRGSNWPIGGGHVPPPADKPWVFVHLAPDASTPPRFFVLTQAELHSILAPGDAKYRANYLAKHGEEYGDRAGVVTLTVKDAEPHLGKWMTIVRMVNAV